MKKLSQQGISAIQALLFVMLVVLTLLVGSYIYNTKDEASNITNFDECVAAGNPVMESYPEQCAANGQTFVNQAQAADIMVEETSGKGAFALTFPADWGTVYKDTASDFFIISGHKQPEGRTKIASVDGYGSDGGGVFSVYLQEDKDGLGNTYFGHKNTKVTEYLLENAKENPIKGKKYSYAYPSDEKAGIGYWRFQGDRDYEYVFDIPGPQHLRVTYSVYGEDPRNNLETVEQVINSIRLL